jgi:hypothetical protein
MRARESEASGGLTMPEFMFRNLSVKLYPPEGDNDPRSCTDRTSQPVPIECAWHTKIFPACQNTCFDGTYTYPMACDPTSTSPVWCGVGTNLQCGFASTQQGFVDPELGLISPADFDARGQLVQLKSNLQNRMAAVDAQLNEVEKAAKPTSVEQIDDLKSQLLAAVTELDEQRARLEGGGQAPARG